MGQFISEWHKQINYRRCPSGADSIFYRVNEGIIEIMAIVGRQEIDSIFWISKINYFYSHENNTLKYYNPENQPLPTITPINPPYLPPDHPRQLARRNCAFSKNLHAPNPYHWIPPIPTYKNDFLMRKNKKDKPNEITNTTAIHLRLNKLSGRRSTNWSMFKNLLL